MSDRKEVFQAKVLKKLYPASNQLKLEKVFHPPPTYESESAAKEAGINAKSIKPVKGTGDGGRPAILGKKLYTVLPPPEGYTGDTQLPVVGPELKINNTSDLSEEEADDVQEDLPRRKRRRKKRKLSQVSADGSEGKESVTGSEVGATQTAGACERLSRNKKRKLKKKRHKERMRNLGLVPQASAVEFTYQPREDEEEEEDKSDEEEEEEELNDEQTADVMEFLKTTLQTYISDRSSPERTPPSGADTLLDSLSARTAPPGELARLRVLKELVLRRRVKELERALGEFRSSTNMPPEEASAVCILFRYWITDIFPLGPEVLKT